MRERTREARGVGVLESCVNDVRYAARGLRKSLGFTVSAALVLGLALGASVTVLNTVRAVLLDPLPYGEPERIVGIWVANPERTGDRLTISYPNYLDWARSTRTLSSMGAYTSFLTGWTLAREGEATEEVAAAWVAGDFFETLAAPPLLGRWLTVEDVEEQRAQVVLSEGVWHRLFGADPSIIGRTIDLDFRDFEVIGVMPADFAYPAPDAEAWAPLTTVDARGFPYMARGVNFASMVGRLAKGRTIEEAQAELAQIASDLEAANPDSNAGQSAATVVPLRDFIVGDVEIALWSLLGAVAFFLLLATANLANLLIARSLSRSKELALRRSLGATARRMARQILTESALLALLGAVLGSAIAAVLTEAISTGAGSFLPRAAGAGMSLGVLLAVFFGSALVTTVASVWPVIRGAATNSAESLQSGVRQVGEGVRGLRIRRGLVAAEVGLAVVLLVGAGLSLQSFGALLRVDAGFRPEGVAAMTVNVPFSRYSAGGAWVTRHEEILTELRALPGIEAAAGLGYLPIRSPGEGIAVRVPGIYEPPAGEGIVPRVFPVTTHAFRSLGVTLVAGRDFLPSDGPDDRRVAIVNETFVRDVLQGGDAIGVRFTNEPTEWEIVGVVGDVRHEGLREPAPPTFYTHMPQAPRARQSYVVRTDGDLGSLFVAMRSAVEAIDPQLAIAEMLPLTSVTSDYRARPRVITAVTSGFAALALILATLGVYGVLAYTVRGRLREMGLRSALGASRTTIARDVVVGGMRPAVAGLAVGLVGASLLSGYLESLLFEVEPLNLTTFVGGGALLLLAAAAACVVPASWAARVDPAESLRAE
jgi:predicted permease